MKQVLADIVILCCLVFAGAVSCEKLAKIGQEKKPDLVGDKAVVTNITVVYFPADDGRWCDRIISGFEERIAASGLTLNIKKVAWIYRKNDSLLIENIIKTKPNMVFLPTDSMYENFSRDIYGATQAKIIFAASHSPLSRLNMVPSEAQAGVFHFHPVLKSFSLLQSTLQIRSIGIIRGEAASSRTMLERLRVLIPDLIAEEFFTTSFQEYAKKIYEFAGKYDVIWPMAPFGVVDERTGKWVSEHELQILLDSVPKPTIGWGCANNLKRTIEFVVDPEMLGRYAADAAVAVIRNKQFKIHELKNFRVMLSERHLRRLRKKIPRNFSDSLPGSLLDSLSDPLLILH